MQTTRRATLRAGAAAAVSAVFPVFSIALLGAASTLVCSAQAIRPNIVYILADDMGLGDVGAYNPDGKIPTPHIDRIAREGVRFTDAHTNSSVCTPTRYGILTGRYAWRTRMKRGVLSGHSPRLIEPGRETVASFLKEHGYRTACFGKWHLGMDWQLADDYRGGESLRISSKYVDPTKPIRNGPNAVGFDHYFGISASLNMDPHAYIQNDRLLGTLEYLTDLNAVHARGFTQPAKPGWAAREFVQEEVLSELAKRTCKWIRESANRPFFVYLPLPSPHSPIVPSARFKGKSGLNLHGDFCMESDWLVGEVLGTLDELGVADNTIVVFTADNGTSPKAGLKVMQEQGHFTSLIYRGLKGTTWEGGHRVPFVLRWPAGADAGTVSDQAICTTDLLATCAELLTAPLPADTGEDSVSFLPALKGLPIPGLGQRLIVHHSDAGVFALRRGKWKLMLDNKGGSRRRNPKDKPVINASDALLFDMAKDSVESTNLSAEHPEVVTELKKALAEAVRTGRSTPGPEQPTDLDAPDLEWPQIDRVREFLR